MRGSFLSSSSSNLPPAARSCFPNPAIPPQTPQEPSVSPAMTCCWPWQGWPVDQPCPPTFLRRRAMDLSTACPTLGRNIPQLSSLVSTRLPATVKSYPQAGQRATTIHYSDDNNSFRPPAIGASTGSRFRMTSPAMTNPLSGETCSVWCVGDDRRSEIVRMAQLMSSFRPTTDRVHHASSPASTSEAGTCLHSTLCTSVERFACSLARLT